MPAISERTACRLLQVSRSAPHRPTKGKRARATLSEEFVAKLEPLIQEYPTYGYRRLWALLRFRHGHTHNRKAVYRALRLKALVGASTHRDLTASSAVPSESDDPE
jgi:putative transposase